MRIGALALLLLALAAPARPDEPFLRLLPDDVAVTARLPGQKSLAAGAAGYRALLRALGREGTDPAEFFYGSATPGGLDPDRAPGLAIGASGGVVRYLPAKDKAVLSRALSGAVGRGALYREEGDWILLSEGGRGAGNAQGEALPEGEFALRLQNHPVLGALLHPLDRLDLSLEAAPAFLSFTGRFLPGEKGSTAEALLEPCGAGFEGLVDYLAPSLLLRVETGYAATALSAPIVSRVAAHARIADGKARTRLERLLREALSALDPKVGIAFGMEVKDGLASLVLLGKIAGGPPSPLLARIAASAAHAVDPAHLTAIESKGGLVSFGATVSAEAPSLEGLPRSLHAIFLGLGDPERPLEVTIRSTPEGWVAAGVGPRGALLAGDAVRRLAKGTGRSQGSELLRELRAKADGSGSEAAPGYALGIVLSGAAIEGMPDEDRAALRSWFGATESAVAPAHAALAAFRDGNALRLRGRALYAP